MSDNEDGNEEQPWLDQQIKDMFTQTEQMLQTGQPTAGWTQADIDILTDRTSRLPACQGHWRYLDLPGIMTNTQKMLETGAMPPGWTEDDLNAVFEHQENLAEIDNVPVVHEIERRPLQWPHHQYGQAHLIQPKINPLFTQSQPGQAYLVLCGILFNQCKRLLNMLEWIQLFLRTQPLRVDARPHNQIDQALWVMSVFEQNFNLAQSIPITVARMSAAATAVGKRDLVRRVEQAQRILQNVFMCLNRIGFIPSQGVGPQSVLDLVNNSLQYLSFMDFTFRKLSYPLPQVLLNRANQLNATWTALQILGSHFDKLIAIFELLVQVMDVVRTYTDRRNIPNVPPFFETTIATGIIAQTNISFPEIDELIQLFVVRYGQIAAHVVQFANPMEVPFLPEVVIHEEVIRLRNAFQQFLERLDHLFQLDFNELPIRDVHEEASHLIDEMQLLCLTALHWLYNELHHINLGELI